MTGLDTIRAWEVLAPTLPLVAALSFIFFIICGLRLDSLKLPAFRPCPNAAFGGLRTPKF